MNNPYLPTEINYNQSVTINVLADSSNSKEFAAKLKKEGFQFISNPIPVSNKLTEFKVVCVNGVPDVVKLSVLINSLVFAK